MIKTTLLLAVVFLAGCAPYIIPATPIPSASLIHEAVTYTAVSTGTLPVSFPTALPATISPTSPPSIGFVHIPAVADAGNFFLFAGTTITLTWDDPPLNAMRYDFLLSAPSTHESTVIGTDVVSTDGVSVQWTVPERVEASLRAAAYYSDGHVIYSYWSGDVYSEKAPPKNICTLASGTSGALEIFDKPKITSSPYAELIPGQYAQVYERTSDGWYRIDASVAVVRQGSTGMKMGWVVDERSIILFGPCDSIQVTNR